MSVLSSEILLIDGLEHRPKIHRYCGGILVKAERIVWNSKPDDISTNVLGLRPRVAPRSAAKQAKFRGRNS